MAAGLRRAFRQRRKEDNSRCVRCGTGGDRVSGGAELGRADRGSWEPDNLLGAGAASATGRQGAMGSRLCQAQGDPGRVDSAPTGFSIKMGGTTSIDVTREGVDKAYGLERLSCESGIP